MRDPKRSRRAKPQKTRYEGVYKRVLASGTVVYDFTYSVEGVRYPPVRGKYRTLAEAKKARDEKIHEAQHGFAVAGKKKTLADFIERDWLPEQEARVMDGTLSQSTVNQRRSDALGRIKTALGDENIRRIDVKKIREWQAELRAEGLSPHTISNLLVTLGTILEAAKGERLIIFNPRRDVRGPKLVRKRQAKVLTLDQMLRFISGIEDDDLKNLVRVAAFGGMRIGELLALRWANVDLHAENPTVTIIERIYDGKIEQRTKTSAGRRRIVLAPQAADALGDQLLLGRHSDDGLVFPSPEGRAWRASNLSRRHWRDARDAAGQPDLTFHDLRHFFTSHAVAAFARAGISKAVSMQLVGHADNDTHDAYSHPIAGSEFATISALGSEFTPKSDQHSPDTPEGDTLEGGSDV